MNKLHDIKPLVEIPDSSLYTLIGLVILTFIIGAFIIFFVYKLLKKVDSKHKTALTSLQTITYTDAKEDAYTITHLASQLNLNANNILLLERLNLELEQYKYKKVVEQFSITTKEEIKLFLEEVQNNAIPK